MEENTTQTASKCIYHNDKIIKKKIERKSQKKTINKILKGIKHMIHEL